MERGDKQESRRQFHLNYADAHFTLLMAETPPPSTCRPKHMHVNTSADLEWEYPFPFVTRTLGRGLHKLKLGGNQGWRVKFRLSLREDVDYRLCCEGQTRTHTESQTLHPLVFLQYSGFAALAPDLSTEGKLRAAEHHRSTKSRV